MSVYIGYEKAVLCAYIALYEHAGNSFRLFFGLC